jgi:hypothetical protein
VPGLVEAALNAGGEAGQEAVDVSCRAVVMLLPGVNVPVAVAIPVPPAGALLGGAPIAATKIATADGRVLPAASQRQRLGVR